MRKQLINKRRENKHMIYLNAFIETIRNYADKMESEEDFSLYLKRAVYYGVKIVNSIDRPIDKTKSNSNLEIADTIKALMSCLTPREFENLFPIDKTYDGKKWQSKDYYYTKEYLKKLDPDKSIGDKEIHSFLWEYQNIEITMFNVNLIGFMSDIREGQGYQSIMEEWIDKVGIEEAKKQVETKLPDYLRIVK